MVQLVWIIVDGAKWTYHHHQTLVEVVKDSYDLISLTIIVDLDRAVECRSKIHVVNTKFLIPRFRCYGGGDVF